MSHGPTQLMLQINRLYRRFGSVTVIVGAPVTCICTTKLHETVGVRDPRRQCSREFDRRTKFQNYNKLLVLLPEFGLDFWLCIWQ